MPCLCRGESISATHLVSTLRERDRATELVAVPLEGEMPGTREDGHMKIGILQVDGSKLLPLGDRPQDIGFAKHMERYNLQEPVKPPQIEARAKSDILLYDQKVHWIEFPCPGR